MVITLRSGVLWGFARVYGVAASIPTELLCFMLQGRVIRDPEAALRVRLPSTYLGTICVWAEME